MARCRCGFGLEPAAWQGEFDPPRELLYDTAIFRVELRQNCGADLEYLERRDDSFVGGFAEGE